MKITSKSMEIEKNHTEQVTMIQKYEYDIYLLIREIDYKINYNYVLQTQRLYKEAFGGGDAGSKGIFLERDQRTDFPGVFSQVDEDSSVGDQVVRYGIELKFRGIWLYLVEGF